MARNILSSIKWRSTLLIAGSGEVPMSAAASATTFLGASPVIDTQGYDSVVAMANPGGVGHIKLQMSSATGSGFEDVAGSDVTGSAAHQLLAVELVRPQKRYVKALVAATTGSVLGKITWGLGQPRTVPITQTVSGASGVAVAEILNAAATGTA